MRRLIAIVLAVTLTAVLAGCDGGGDGGYGGQDGGGSSAEEIPEGWGEPAEWVLPSEGGVDPEMFVEGVDNPYWPLEPGARWSYAAATGEGTETIEVEVLPDTREVMGVTCTVVRDVVSLDGEVIEDTRDWYAQDADGNVWYMGEDVDNYRNGELLDHEGAWEAGVDGAEPGIRMWADPDIGGPAYYQEYYPDNAEDLGKDLRDDASATVPAGEYADLLVIEEWNPLDPEVVERKYYAAGVGAVKEETVRGGDEVVELTRFQAP